MPEPTTPQRSMPRWIPRAVVLFWLGWIVSLLFRWTFDKLYNLLILLLVSLFLSLAIEPGVNKLASRGWRRGTATITILLIVLFAMVGFLVAIGTLVAQQVADVLANSEDYVSRTVNFVNEQFNTEIDAAEVIADINDPNGRVQRYVRDQSGTAVNVSVAALGGLLQTFSVLLFTFYLVADGPKLRRAICSRLPAERQKIVLDTWELATNKTGGYLYSRLLLALVSAVFHWIVFTALGVTAPVALALWVGLVSQFLPVVGTYLAGVLPVLLALLDGSPRQALGVVIAVLVYQQIENYALAPRVTAKTMELHPALSFGAALAGAATLGVVGAILALPAAAMFQAIASEYGRRHPVIDSPLTKVRATPSRNASRLRRKRPTDE